MPTLSPGELHRLVIFSSLAHHLQQLDAVWTHHLQQSPIAKSDIPALKTMASQMQQLLVAYHQAADDVRPILAAHPDVVEQTYATMMSDSTLGNEDKNRWTEMVAQQGSIGMLVDKALERVAQREAQERDALATQMQQLEDTHSAPGDLSAAFYCGFFITCAIAGGVLGTLGGGPIPWAAAMMAASAAGASCAMIGVF